MMFTHLYLLVLNYAALTWITIQHVLFKYKISKRHVKVLCFMDQLNSHQHFHQFDTFLITLLYFLMQNNTAVLSISTTVANLALSESQPLRIIQTLK